MGCSRGVPGLFRGVPGCSGGVPGVFRGYSGVFQGCSGVFRGVPGFTDTHKFYLRPILLHYLDETATLQFIIRVFDKIQVLLRNKC